ncbi:excalibur calcium-binding domain-containing protein [Paenibacillus psychroresistens]|uniref:excalibur calcium-binding domain-containing protein n=1 Tax=Paenibacillus psychroresistens TaxID=1778678 RepID=UPI001D0474B7|nr:excalibur calcium-binding domain-containing protein [Paenibacillus psychroresistens]
MFKASSSTAASTPTPTPTPSNVIDIDKYKSCAEVKAAGKAPIRTGEPGYSSSLDRDGDGIACEIN